MCMWCRVVLQDGSAALWTLHATQWRHSLLLPAEQAADGKRLKVPRAASSSVRMLHRAQSCFE